MILKELELNLRGVAPLVTSISYFFSHVFDCAWRPETRRGSGLGVEGYLITAVFKSQHTSLSLSTMGKKGKQGQPALLIIGHAILYFFDFFI